MIRTPGGIAEDADGFGGASPDGAVGAAEAMAEALQFQLRRLEAMQKAAEDLFALPQVGQDIFPRGMPEGLSTQTDTVYDAALYDLLRAFGDIKRRAEYSNYELPSFSVMSMEAAMVWVLAARRRAKS